MSAPYFVEVLARNGDVLHRHKVKDLPIRLGRAYDNDFIIDDAHSAAHHAQVSLDENGAMLLQDLGSRNGVYVRGKRHASVVIKGDTVVRIGHTNVRVRPANFPVAPELHDRTMHGWEGGAPGLVGVLMIAIFAISTLWVSDTQSFQAVRYLQAMAYGIGAGLAWSGIWAFANRLFGRHARLGRHLFVTGCGVTAMTIFKVLSSLAAYAFSLEFLTRYGNHAAIMIVCGMLYFHLSTIKPNRPRPFAIACLVLFTLGSGLTLMSNEERYGRLSDDLYMSLLLPPSVRVSPDHSVDEFMGNVARIKAGLDVERVKKIKDDATDADDD
jgi:hypothetical protein